MRVVFGFNFICLMIPVLAAAYKGFGENALSGDSSLWKYFLWSHVNKTALQLSWLGQTLSEKKVTTISVTATSATNKPTTTHYSANVGDGQLTLGGLLSNTGYTLTTHVLTSGGPAVTSTIHVTTGQSMNKAVKTRSMKRAITKSPSSPLPLCPGP